MLRVDIYIYMYTHMLIETLFFFILFYLLNKKYLGDFQIFSQQKHGPKLAKHVLI